MLACTRESFTTVFLLSTPFIFALQRIELQKISRIDDDSTPAADGCRYVFLDLGANMAMHDRFLFDPERYPKAFYPRMIFDEFFPESRQSRSDVCAFAFEPNPIHVDHLKNLESAYSAKGHRLTVFNAGVGTSAGTLPFCHNNHSIVRESQVHNEWGFHACWDCSTFVDARKRDLCYLWQIPVDVPVIDLSSWMLHHVLKRHIPPPLTHKDPPPAVVIKMDIEGAEFALLPKLILSGALCGVTSLTLEWHACVEQRLHRIGQSYTFQLPNASSEPLCQQAIFIQSMLEHLVSQNVLGCSLQFVSNLDDESYGDSVVDFPGDTRAIDF